MAHEHERAGNAAARLSGAEVERLVLADHGALVGKVVLVDRMICSDMRNEPNEVPFDPPAVVRIVAPGNAEATREDVVRWMDDELIDPVYAVEVLAPHTAFVGLRPYFVYGATRSTKPDFVDAHLYFHLADDAMQERYRDAPALDDKAPGGCAPGGRTREAAMAEKAARERVPAGTAGDVVAAYVDFARRHDLRVRVEAVVMMADHDVTEFSIARGRGRYQPFPLVGSEPRAEGAGIGHVLRAAQRILVEAEMGGDEPDRRKAAEQVGEAMRRVLSADAFEEFLDDLGDAPALRAAASPSP